MVLYHLPTSRLGYIFDRKYSITCLFLWRVLWTNRRSMFDALRLLLERYPYSQEDHGLCDGFLYHHARRDSPRPTRMNPQQDSQDTRYIEDQEYLYQQERYRQ